MDKLQITPISHKGQQYILVLIDNYNHFNQIYMMEKKSNSEPYIEAYLNEIKDKLNITLEFLHTDCGGEFSSKIFLPKLKCQGICLEQGPPDSPQTNDVAKWFNQAQLNKIRCILGQSNIPIKYLDEAANHASVLLNHLPHRFLDLNTPSSFLEKDNCSIEPRISIQRFIPFGMKVLVKKLKAETKIDKAGETFKALTFEKYSDRLRLLDRDTGRICISCDYSVSNKQVKIELRKPESILTQDSSQTMKLTIPKHHSTTTLPTENSVKLKE
ncbi:hypothetical protein O181_041581 [Austropuccinia psidii MF-1]|uniref:Integrase catalytic domain-containing protein n=1 Tax=Austropuccinia psidii MF-1 TaxID=1389203 RepID=A0A9Q3HED2_9BASI|nr:hypothetical protein [Austropuccinia psidii MF-1]